jgi:biofilm PGA synthesis N-glycosyltransferase PgaC
MGEVTFYVPCYNVAQYLDRVLTALLRQTHPVAEVLIVDDGSRDETVAVARRYPVRVLRHETNRGLAAARNTALAEVRTEFVAAIDADVELEPDWLARTMRNFGRAGVVGVGGKLLEKYTHGPGNAYRAERMKQHYGEEWRLDPGPLGGCDAVFRIGALREAGGYNERYRTNYEDCDMSRRLMAKGGQLVYEPAAVCWHLRTDTIRSVLRTAWRWDFYIHYHQGRYNRAWRKYIDNLRTGRWLVSKHLVERNFAALPVDLLLPLYHTWEDWRYFHSSDRLPPHADA